MFGFKHNPPTIQNNAVRVTPCKYAGKILNIKNYKKQEKNQLKLIKMLSVDNINLLIFMKFIKQLGTIIFNLILIKYNHQYLVSNHGTKLGWLACFNSPQPYYTELQKSKQNKIKRVPF